MMAKRKDYSSAGDQALSLGSLLGFADERRTDIIVPDVEISSEKNRDPLKARLRLSMERAGRGGKTVTRLTGLVAGAEAKALSKKLKSSLGCGASFEGDDLIFQGDHRERLRELLTRMGARDVK